MKLTNIQYNQLKNLIESAAVSNSNEHQQLSESAPGVYNTERYVGGKHKITYFSLDNTKLKKFFSELVDQDEKNIVTMHKIQYALKANTKAHHDKATFTLVIMLESIDLEGGEFYINGEFTPFKEKREYITYNGGKDLHEVKEITKGKREVMVVWWYDKSKLTNNTSLI